MLRNLSIVLFLGLAACGGSKSQAQDPSTAENSSTDTSTPEASPNECCCQTEMHSCAMKDTDACEQDDGQCTGDDAAHCDCMDEPEGDDAP
jgi:hypothetical protein